MPKTGTPNSYGYDAEGKLLRFAEHRPPHTAETISAVWNKTRNAVIARIKSGDLDLPEPGPNESWLRELDGASGEKTKTVRNALTGEDETYRLVEWKPGDKPRPWDMGHTRGEEYRRLHDRYMRDGNEEKFLEEYTDAELYDASTPERNRSHMDEDMTPLPPRA